jgi:hypothetical protein
MRDALILALNREAEGSDGKPTKKLYLIADAVVDKAASGDVAAASFVADRVDGKAPQTLLGDPDAPLFSIDGLKELLGAKLDRIAETGTAPEPQGRLN